MKLQMFTIIVLSLLLLGVSTLEGCPSTTSASKSGLDFSLEPGLNKLSSGKTISQGELFYVTLRIENYDTKEKTGIACIKDDMDDVYGGIKEGCIPFKVPGAEETSPESKSKFMSKKTDINPGISKINFPSSSEYQYSGLPATQNAKLMITTKYSQSSVISSPKGISVREPTEMIQLSQIPAPISISVEKSATKREEGHKISLDIKMNKQSDATIYSPDFKNENYLYMAAEMPPKTLECEPIGNYDKELLGKSLVEIKNKNFIRCSTLVYEEDQTWPLQIRLDYGVKIKKEFSFIINAD